MVIFYINQFKVDHFPINILSLKTDCKKTFYGFRILFEGGFITSITVRY